MHDVVGVSLSVSNGPVIHKSSLENRVQEDLVAKETQPQNASVSTSDDIILNGTSEDVSFYLITCMYSLFSAMCYRTCMKIRKIMVQKICRAYAIGSSPQFLHVTFINCLDVGIALGMKLQLYMKQWVTMAGEHLKVFYPDQPLKVSLMLVP